jgi:hypothetical protein
VRTKLENFKTKEKCEDDKSQMCCESEAIAKIVKSCKDVIFINNPPINIYIEDDDDRERVENNKKIRARSRIILLDHLKTVCQEKSYKFKTWNKIAAYIELNGIENIAEEMERNLNLEILAVHDSLSK